MKRYQKIFVFLAVLLFGVGTFCYFVWKKGTPYQTAFWSPNNQYYVQKYSNLTPSRFIPAMPGQGSDTIDGYVRLFDKNGKLIDEVFVTFIRDVEPVWVGNKVYLTGVAEMDDNPWILPASSE